MCEQTDRQTDTLIAMLHFRTRGGGSNQKSYAVFQTITNIGKVLWGGGGKSGTADERSPGCFSWVLPKRSIPEPEQHRKDSIQQESLGTDML